jgi:hypothetical protein
MVIFHSRVAGQGPVSVFAQVCWMCSARMCSACCCAALPEAPSVQDCPHPSVAPEAATLRQLHALRTGDTETVFAFASPANRRATGPLERFAALLKSPIYCPLVGHLESEVRLSEYEAVRL